MIEVKVECVGISPILMDCMDDATLEGLRTGVRPQVRKDVPAEEVAGKKLYKDENGEVGIPAQCLFAALVNAGRLVKNGKRQISAAGSTTLPSLMSIRETFMAFNGYADKKWVVDKRRGRLQDGTAICVVRPKFNKWGFDATIEIDEKAVDERTIQELFRVAGTAMGLGAYRPNCKGPYGRFKVSKWTAKKAS